LPEKRFRPLIVPIFIPNQGCPHKCVFCEQERITSQHGNQVTKEFVTQQLEKAIHSSEFDPGRKPEIAFYGGTFTGLPFERMLELLKAAIPFIEQGFFLSTRISTRPDALDEQRLKAMRDNGVSTVELGAQSMDNRVLDLSKRGHSAEDTVKAVQFLKGYGFKVGLQLMPGLPGDSRESFYSTITKVISLHPDMVRLYPAVVIRGTALAHLYEAGTYRPLLLEEAVEICMESCFRLEEEGIPVIRIGLMSSPSLLEKGQIVAGPWHTAFGFLVRSGIYQRNLESELPGPGEVTNIRILAPKRDIPLLRGYRNRGLKEIEAKTGAAVVSVQFDDSLPHGHIRVEGV